MKALVTGATGFIGMHVVRNLLDEGHAVRIFTRKKELPGVFGGRSVEIASGNLENARSLVGALEDIEVLYHIGEIKNTSKAASEKNVRLLEEVLTHARNQRVQRIVFVSSITVAGIPSGIPANEDTSPRMILSDQYTDYKRRSEELLREKGGGVEYSIIRPAPVYGPGSRYLGRLVSLLESLALVGIPFPGNAENLAPLIHVSDLASAIYRAGVEPEAAGQTFNLTDGVRHSWREFFEIVTERPGNRLRIIPIPKLVLQLSALPFDLVSGFLGISLDPASYVSYFSADICFDNAKARDLLGWQPHYTLTEGAKEMREFYRKKDS